MQALSKGTFRLVLFLFTENGWIGEVLKMASAGPPLDIQIVIAKVKTLINAQLKNILKRENLPVSGVKSAMQTRIIERMWTNSSFFSFKSLYVSRFALNPLPLN